MSEQIIAVVIDIEDRKRQVAYRLWEEAGNPDGQAETHWLAACEIVEAELNEPEWLQRLAAEAKEQAQAEETRKRGRKAA